MHRKLNRWLRLPTLAYVPVLIAAASVSVAAYFVDKSYEYSNRLHLRIQTVAALDLKSDTLHRRLHFEINSVRELQRSLSEETAINALGFQRYAAAIMAGNPDILAVRATYLSGLIYEREIAGFKAGDAIAVDDEKLLPEIARDGGSGLAVPEFSRALLLGSGRYGFRITMPVFAKSGDIVVQRGSITALIDGDKFFKKSGMSYFDGSHHFAIQMEDADDGAMKPFFRTDQVQTVFGSDPVTTSMNVLSSTWRIAAIPEGGWMRPPPAIGWIRILYVAIALIVIVPFLRGARLRRLMDKSTLALAKREAALKRLTKRLDLALDSYQCGVWEAAANVEETYWDDRMQELHGVKGQRDWATRRNWLSLVHPDEKAKARETLQKAMETLTRFSLTCRVVRPDGDIRHIRYVGQFHEGPGREQRMYGIAVDVTEDIALQAALEQARRESEAKNNQLERALSRLSAQENQLRVASDRFKLAVEAYGCGIWETNLDTNVSYWDERMHELFGVPFTDGRTDTGIWLSRIHPDDKERVSQAREHAISTGQRFAATYRVRPTPDTLRYLRVVGVVHQEAGGDRKFTGLSIDATDEIENQQALMAAKNDAEAKRAELETMHASMQFHATHDPLTGLFNRRGLDAELERLAQEPPSADKRVTLLHLDLDRFKHINDTLGHAAGDAMLTFAAEVLRQNTRKSDMVARIGGDEFVVLCRNNASNRDIAALAQRIIDRMNVPVLHEGHECRFGVSIGIAREQMRRNSIKKLLVNADIALYRAKAHGRNRFEFFTASLQGEIKRNKRLADEILRGIENDEFEAWYQPQFCAESQDLTGVEALVRWNHPERGLLTPDAFLKTAEEINALSTIDRRVLELALKDQMRWTAAGVHVPKVSVNVSARRLQDDQLVKSLKDLAIAPGQIAFELVESIYLDDDDDMINRNIRRLKALGIDIEIDDFGTGHTSIVSLLKLEPKRLKIDRQLVQPMLTSGREFALVRSIIEIGASLDIETVAEGVETMVHALRLKEMGCTLLQGYAFARPMNASALQAFVLESPWRETAPRPQFAAVK